MIKLIITITFDSAVEFITVWFKITSVIIDKDPVFIIIIIDIK